MLNEIIIAVLAIQGTASTIVAYKSYKTVKQLEDKINQSTAAVEELKDKVDGAGKDISQEVRKHIYNLSFMGIKTKN